MATDIPAVLSAALGVITEEEWRELFAVATMNNTAPPKLTREQALEKYGDVRCSLREFHNGDLVFIGDRAPDGLSATVRITLRAGDYDMPLVSYDQSDVFTMREDDDRCRVVILEGTQVVYEAEPRGPQFTVDDEDPDGDV